MKRPSYENSKSLDLQWIFTLFGTAIGAGLLYLPVQAGESGFWAVLTVMIFAFPLTYFSHKNMANVVTGSSDGGIAEVFSHSLGKFFGIICVILYFLAIFLNMPLYSIGLNNELSNFLVTHNFTAGKLSTNIWFSFSILLCLLVVVSLGINIILKFMQAIVILLIVLVVALSLYIIPNWNYQFITQAHFDVINYIKGVLMVLPILILSMNHSPVISSLVIFYRDNFHLDHNNEENKVYKIIKINCLLLFIFVLLFIFSCLMSITIPELSTANANNLSIVTLIRQHDPRIFIQIVSPLIVFTAIISSFIGCYIGSKEALKYLLEFVLNKTLMLDINKKYINYLTIILIFLVLWVCTICDFRILDIIGIMVAPTVAFLLYILPVVIIYKNVNYKEYRKALLNALLFIFGILIIFGYLIGEFLT